jgi:4-hydroxy-tetrahydrodipicolinate synthase
VAKLSEPTLAGQVRLAERAVAAGASAIKLALPHQFRAQDDAVAVEWLLAPARATGLPFMVESDGDLTIQVLDRLCEEATFLGFEETTRDPIRFFDLVRRYGERVAVIAGSEDVLAFTLLAGAQGFMTATPNFAPAFMRDMLAAARAGDALRVMPLFASLREFRALFWDGVRRGVPLFASYGKASLALLGRPVGPPRPPLRPLTKDEVAALRGVLQRAFGFHTKEVST